MVKIITGIRLSEEVVDPATGERREIVHSERRIATLPMLVRALANPDETLRRYIVSVARRTLEVSKIAWSMLGSTVRSRTSSACRYALRRVGSSLSFPWHLA